MATYKPGDKIKVVRSSHDWLFGDRLIGKIGTVQSNMGGIEFIRVSFSSENSPTGRPLSSQGVYRDDVELVLEAVQVGDIVVYTREGEGSVLELRGAKAKVLETVGVGYSRDAECVAVYGERAEVTESNAPLIKVAFESKMLSSEFQSGIWMLLSSFKKFVPLPAPNPTVRKPNARRFYLVRAEDFSGISGTGVVAEGVVFADGTAVLRWLTYKPSFGTYNSIADLIEIHGHEGRTLVKFIDSNSAHVGVTYYAQ